MSLFYGKIEKVMLYSVTNYKKYNTSMMAYLCSILLVVQFLSVSSSILYLVVVPPTWNNIKICHFQTLPNIQQHRQARLVYKE